MIVTVKLKRTFPPLLIVLFVTCCVNRLFNLIRVLIHMTPVGSNDGGMDGDVSVLEKSLLERTAAVICPPCAICHLPLVEDLAVRRISRSFRIGGHCVHVFVFCVLLCFCCDCRWQWTVDMSFIKTGVCLFSYRVFFFTHNMYIPFLCMCIHAAP